MLLPGAIDRRHQTGFNDLDFGVQLGAVDWNTTTIGGHYVDGSDAQLMAQRLVSECRSWWYAREQFRAQRRLGRNYFKGYQWGDKVQNEDGEWVTERDLILARGQVPIVMNIAGSAIQNVAGQFRTNKSQRMAFAVDRQDEQATEMVNQALRYVRRYNQVPIIESDNFLEHTLSGASGFRTSYQWEPKLQRFEVTEHILDQTKLFYNLDVRDRRLSGLRMVGMLHDVTITEIIQRFATSKREAEDIRAVYAQSASQPSWGEAVETATWYGFQGRDYNDFYRPRDPRLVRVIECWRPVFKWVRKGIDPLFDVIPEGYGDVMLPDNEIARIQNQRREMGQPMLELDEARLQPIWHYWFLTPEGIVLKHGPTPYYHGEHPFTLGSAFYLDGEVWGMMQNIKDPQKWLNRVLGQIDYQMATASKGTPHVDQDVLEHSGLTLEEYMERYSKPGLGVALRKGNRPWQDVIHYHLPNSVQPGTFDLIPILTSFVERVSGVSEAAQGITPKSGTPASLYERQVMQASTNVLIYLESYFETLHQKDKKVVQNILQSFTEPRAFSQGGVEQPITYDPDRVREVDWEMSLAEVEDTATLRQQNEFWLLQLLQGGFIPVDIYLSESSHPKADNILMKLQQAMTTPMGGMGGDEAALLQAAMMGQQPTNSVNPAPATPPTPNGQQ